MSAAKLDPAQCRQMAQLVIRMPLTFDDKEAIFAQLTAAADLAVERDDARRDYQAKSDALDEAIAEIDRLRSQLSERKTLTKERVREVVLAAMVEPSPTWPPEWCDRVATRAAKELAGAVVGLSERDQEILSVLIDDVQAFGAGDDVDRKDERFQSDTLALLRRLKQNGARREADLREAFLAGKEWEAGRWPDDPKDADAAAAEYARSKAGAQ